MTNSPESVRDWCTWLVLPTYNEAPNIESIVSGANEALGGTVNEHHILVVDDGSPDGTGRIADRRRTGSPARTQRSRSCTEPRRRVSDERISRALSTYLRAARTW